MVLLVVRDPSWPDKGAAGARLNQRSREAHPPARLWLAQAPPGGGDLPSVSGNSSDVLSTEDKKYF